MAVHLQPRARGKFQRFLEAIPRLPGVIEVRHLQQDLRLSRRIHRAIHKIFSTQMHVRVQRRHDDRLREGNRSVAGRVRVAGKNRQVARIGAALIARQHLNELVLGLSRGQFQSDAGSGPPFPSRWWCSAC